MSNKYLLEIGVEELPARFVGDALKQLKNNSIKLFKEERIGFESIEVYSTPRRLTIIVNGVDERQSDLEEKSKGPTKKIAFDEEGNPTKALLGFMRGQKIDLESIVIESFNGEDYVFANVTKVGQEIEDIISSNIASIIKSITFPKSMKWGGKNLRFARPIRWIISLLNDKVIAFELEEIKVSNITRGHRFLGSNNIEVSKVEDYKELLRENFVILDQNERKDIIKYGSERLARERGGNLELDEVLLDEITNIVEYPTPIIGRIKEEYLTLPQDIVITPMKEHLRFFPVFDDKQRLLPYFITVRNGNDEHIDTVIKGNEKVLGARLEDAKFFYMDDIKEPLESYVEKLKYITFQDKLGSLYDKTKRIQKLSQKVAEHLEVGEETERNIDRAGYLSKADLVTKMVNEFSELQGKMGMEYAKESGENEIVSLAIAEQYLPGFAGDRIPITTAGFILSISDKLDTIAGLFAIGIHPTGSQDPFGLRRQALGIINIILDKKINFKLSEMIETSLYIYVEENGLAFDYNKVKAEIIQFFNIRIRNMFIDEGIRHDIIDAAVGGEIDNIYDMKIKSNKLNDWLQKDGVSEVLSAFNRVSNLAEKSESSEVQRDLLTKDEIDLYDGFNSVEEKINLAIDKKEYDKALDQLVVLKEPIDNFFDNVMVMVDDEKIKNNRLGLLKKIHDSMIKICDLSKIVNK